MNDNEPDIATLQSAISSMEIELEELRQEMAGVRAVNTELRSRLTIAIRNEKVLQLRCDEQKKRIELLETVLVETVIDSTKTSCRHQQMNMDRAMDGIADRTVSNTLEELADLHDSYLKD